jgi:hypothetical protein
LDVTIGVSKRVSQDLSNGSNVASELANFFCCLHVYSLWVYLVKQSTKSTPSSSSPRFYLHRDDLIQAVKYMNLLKGPARHIADDWLREARLHLETRQAADALLAHAAGIGCKEWKDYVSQQEKTLSMLNEAAAAAPPPTSNSPVASS